MTDSTTASATSMPLIQARNVNKVFPNGCHALKDVSLDVQRGEVVVIIGPSGSGKSTLGKLMTGLYTPTSGAMRIDGVDLRQVNPTDLRRNVGAVSQDVSLFYGSIKDNIVMGVPYMEDEAILRAAELSGVAEFAMASTLTDRGNSTYPVEITLASTEGASSVGNQVFVDSITFANTVNIPLAGTTTWNLDTSTWASATTYWGYAPPVKLNVSANIPKLCLTV